MTRLSGAFLKNLGSDFAGVVTAPKNWKAGDWLKFGAVAGTGILIYLFDNDIYKWIQDQRTPSSIEASKYVSKIGNGAYLAAFMGIIYVSGEIFDSTSLRKTALLSLESFLTTAAIVLSIKVLAGRSRPYYPDSFSHDFNPLSFTADHTSFPSGDSATAFAVATTIAEQSPNIAVDILAYGLASLVAVYRVHDQKHWPSDVFVGSALGYFIAKKICALNKNRESGRFQASFSLNPKRQAITFSIAF